LPAPLPAPKARPSPPPGARFRYAAKCKRIVNTAVMNEDKNASVMKVLQQEIAGLRALLARKDAVADEGKARPKP